LTPPATEPCHNQSVKFKAAAWQNWHRAAQAKAAAEKEAAQRTGELASLPNIKTSPIRVVLAAVAALALFALAPAHA
jgi:hypothetical protein